MPGDARSYLTGFALALALTAIPFVLVRLHAFGTAVLVAVIAVAAVLQIAVHLRCFLRLDLTETPRENLLALAFAVLLIVLMVGGSLWIMLDPQERMMP